MSELTLTWRPPADVDIRATLAVHQRGRYDPTQRVTTDGTVWRTCRTPDGPATVRLTATAAVRPTKPVSGQTGNASGRQVVEATAWGPGSQWALDALPDWLGADDRPELFQPHHRVVEQAVRRYPGLRISRSGLIMDALVPAILEQKVTGREAWTSWRRLLAAHGEPAPGPAPTGMRVLPSAERLRMIPSWEWHRAGVGPDRSRTLVRAARAADRLERLATASADEALMRIQAVPGIGPWTAAEVVQRSHGDPDAVSVGDFNLPAAVAYSLAGERTADDARMLELLEPYRGQRYRACLLIAKAGLRPPRRAPRQPIRDYRRM